MLRSVLKCCRVKSSDGEDENSELEDVTYSSGDENQKEEDVQASDEERIPIGALDKELRVERAKYLWKRCYAKIRGAVLVLARFGDLEKRLYLFGTSLKFDFILQEEE